MLKILLLSLATCLMLSACGGGSTPSGNSTQSSARVAAPAAA
ncbi:hypothetical protein [Cupriavidus sp. USMAA2-4]|nr:hypothetical protein [Cupriavidus sp. USMAA2-4]